MKFLWLLSCWCLLVPLASAQPHPADEAKQVLTLYHDLREHEALRRFALLKQQDRRQFSRPALRAFALAGAELEGSLYAPPLARRHLVEALKLSDTPAQRIEVLLQASRLENRLNLLAPARDFLQQASAIAAADACSPALMAELCLTRAEVEGSEGRHQEARLDVKQARHYFDLAGDRVGAARAQFTLARLAPSREQAAELVREGVELLETHRFAARRVVAIKDLLDSTFEPTFKTGELLLKSVAAAEAELRRPEYLLMAVRVRTLLYQKNRVGKNELQARIRQLLDRPYPGAVAETRLVAYVSLAEFHLATNDVRPSYHYYQRALEESERLQPSWRSSLLGKSQPTNLAALLSQLAEGYGDLPQAFRYAQRARDEAAGHEDGLSQGLWAQSVLLSLHLKMSRLDQAQQTLEELVSGIEQLPDIAERAHRYRSIAYGILLSGGNSVQLVEPGPQRPSAGTPGHWLLERIKADSRLASDMASTMEKWVAIERRRGDVAELGRAAEYQLLVLGALDRPLEVIEVGRRAMEECRSQPRWYAQLAARVSRELYGLGRVEEARKLMADAYEQARAARLQSLSSYYALQNALMEGDNTRALGFADAAVREGTRGRPNSFYLALIQRGVLHARLGHLQPAREDLEQALSWLRRRRLPNAEVEASLQLAKLKPELTAELVQRAWLVQRESGRLSQVATQALRLSGALEQTGDLQAAADLCSEALQLLGEGQQLAPALARRNLETVQSWQPLLEKTVDLRIRLGQPRLAAEQIAFWRALEQKQSAAVDPGALPVASEGRARLEQLDQLKSELTGLMNSLRHSEPDREAELQTRYNDVRARFLTTLNQLREHNPEFDEQIGAQGRELLNLQPQLSPGTLLLQYFAGADALYIQAVDRDTLRLERVPLERARLDQLTGRWRAGLSSRAAGADEVRHSAQLLHELLLAPVADQIGKANQVLVLPSGSLWSVPFEALQDRSGSYLVERVAVGYLGSADLLTLGQPAQRGEGSLVAVQSGELEGGQREVQDVVAMFSNGLALLGKQATRAALADAARNARYLHVAAHGHARQKSSSDSYLELADGPLRLQDVYALDLVPGSMVVLAACDTAVGQVRPARELISLATGFRVAGASSVLAALWAVDDQATARFFPPMYRQLLAGQGRAQALRTAKLEMIRDPATRSPYFWAAFTLLGDPR